jgi:drug/metabolite transporter (DMT)-like permease
MGQLDNLPENSEAFDSQATEALLRTMAHELENLKQNLIVQLNQDVERLQTEKNRLIQEIDGLQSQRQQHFEQQQQQLQQLSQNLASQLQEQLRQQLQQMADTSSSAMTSPVGANLLPGEYNDHAYRLLASLDSTLTTTFKTLQQDINSYQSALSQQLGQMHSLEQQGEVILETLVERLNKQLQTAVTQSQLPPADTTVTSRQLPTAKPIPLEFPGAPLPLPPPSKKKFSELQLGFFLVLLSTVALSIHNVVVRIVGNPSQLLGLFTIGGVLKLDLGNSLLILWMRMLVVLPLMVLVTKFLYPAVWRDLKTFFTAKDTRSILNVIGSGCFLFLSQVLIYIAIGDIGPGIAVTILFMYPIITVPLAWLLFGDRPTLLRFGVMLTISLGVVLAAYPSISSTSSMSGFGVGTAVGSGVAFAFYLILMQLGFQKLHPVPVSLVQFSTIFVLSSVSLILPLPFSVKVLPSNQQGLIIGGIILGVLTLLGYLLNNFGVRFLGAARASIIASTGPVLTAILAFVLIPGPKTALQTIQIVGILLVTLGVFALSFERMIVQRRAAKTAKA